MTSTALNSIDVNGTPIYYESHGPDGAPVVVLMSGWCHDHRLFDQLVPHLSDDHRVLCIDWRGHGPDRRSLPDFGYAEQADDTIAALDALGIDDFLAVSHSHGGWANVEVAERLGTDRVGRLVVIDWLMTAAAPEFSRSLAEIQDPEHWIEGRQDLYDVWMSGQEHERVRRHLEDEMSSFGFEMWARSCRVIADAYERFGSPLQRLAQMRERRPVRHLFSQPTDPDYAQAQSDFEAEHDWFSYRSMGGPTHFPTLDIPEQVAAEIRAFNADARAAA